MTFFVGLVLGIIAGLGLVITFLHFEHSQSKHRLELVKDIGFTGFFIQSLNNWLKNFHALEPFLNSLREKKYLDYKLKVIAGETSSFPRISGAIKEIIHNAIEDSITWPAWKVVPILPGDYSFLELKPIGILEVKLVQARNLTDKDIIGKSDPFALLYVRPLPDRIKKSKTILKDTATQHLVVKVDDEGGIQASQFIGCAQVMLKDLHPNKVKDVWLKLVKDLELQRDKKDRGRDFIGRCIITLTRVIIEGGFGDSFCLKGSEIRKLNLRLKWTPQPIH